MTDYEAQDARIAKIIRGRNARFKVGVNRFFHHLTKSLVLPLEVTGIEDFRWEEPYVLGVRSAREYEKLRREQPSYQDEYELLEIVERVVSEWMMYYGEDIAAHVRRKSDGRLFWLGLAELEAVDASSVYHQLLDDYAVWFVNAR